MEAYEDIVQSIKHEISDSIEVKPEINNEPAEDYSMYSEYVYEDDSHLFQAEELEDDNPPTKGLKKHYKRALCGLCGNSYYKDQLKRHIDVGLHNLNPATASQDISLFQKVHYKVKRCKLTNLMKLKNLFSDQFYLQFSVMSADSVPSSSATLQLIWQNM